MGKMSHLESKSIVCSNIMLTRDFLYRYRTYINKAVMEMETKQGSSHAMFFVNCAEDCGFDDGKGLGA